eukprot:CAMPEP_0174255060 /NCGR_PEP_ID=MMETSP0439-20130205/4395_1 /TAXON_ID=0 /ORGANISM="Stereomyxa ramosa, Strain Chinc5" /LENGTH=1390 /DNA_ID=CAMNT_0015337041 /DNA_START=102 /DNA_END=4271 /DNA_ORIENTATION=-
MSSNTIEIRGTVRSFALSKRERSKSPRGRKKRLYCVVVMINKKAEEIEIKRASQFVNLFQTDKVKSDNPKWDYNFFFDLDEKQAPDSVIQFEIMSEDEYNDLDILGVAEVSVTEVASKDSRKTKEENYKVKNEDGKPVGKVLLSILKTSTSGSKIEVKGLLADPKELRISKEIPPEQLEKLSDKEKQRQSTILEIINGERTYVRDINILIHIFQRKFVCVVKRKEEYLGIFSNISTISKIHNELLEALEELRAKSKENHGIITGGVGEIFLLRAPLWKHYAPYCSNHVDMGSKLDELFASYPELITVVEECAACPECRGNELDSFLFTPIQRMVKYPLLLQKLISFTDETTEDYTKLVQATKTIKEAIEQVNTFAINAERITKMNEIVQELEPEEGFSIFESGRYLIQEIEDISKIGEKSNVNLTLFNDCLMVTKATKNRKKAILYVLRLKSLKIYMNYEAASRTKYVTNQSQQMLWIVSDADNMMYSTKSKKKLNPEFIFIFPSKVSRDSWINALKKLGVEEMSKNLNGKDNTSNPKRVSLDEGPKDDHWGLRKKRSRSGSIVQSRHLVQSFTRVASRNKKVGSSDDSILPEDKRKKLEDKETLDKEEKKKRVELEYDAELSDMSDEEKEFTNLIASKFAEVNQNIEDISLELIKRMARLEKKIDVLNDNVIKLSRQINHDSSDSTTSIDFRKESAKLKKRKDRRRNRLKLYKKEDRKGRKRRTDEEHKTPRSAREPRSKTEPSTTPRGSHVKWFGMSITEVRDLEHKLKLELGEGAGTATYKPPPLPRETLVNQKRFSISHPHLKTTIFLDEDERAHDSCSEDEAAAAKTTNLLEDALPKDDDSGKNVKIVIQEPEEKEIEKSEEKVQNEETEQEKRKIGDKRKSKSPEPTNKRKSDQQKGTEITEDKITELKERRKSTDKTKSRNSEQITKKIDQQKVEDKVTELMKERRKSNDKRKSKNSEQLKRKSDPTTKGVERPKESELGKEEKSSEIKEGKKSPNKRKSKNCEQHKSVDQSLAGPEAGKAERTVSTSGGKDKLQQEFLEIKPEDKESKTANKEIVDGKLAVNEKEQTNEPTVDKQIQSRRFYGKKAESSGRHRTKKRVATLGKETTGSKSETEMFEDEGKIRRERRKSRADKEKYAIHSTKEEKEATVEPTIVEQIEQFREKKEKESDKLLKILESSSGSHKTRLQVPEDEVFESSSGSLRTRRDYDSMQTSNDEESDEEIELIKRELMKLREQEKTVEKMIEEIENKEKYKSGRFATRLDSDSYTYSSSYSDSDDSYTDSESYSDFEEDSGNELETDKSKFISALAHSNRQRRDSQTEEFKNKIALSVAQPKRPKRDSQAFYDLIGKGARKMINQHNMETDSNNTTTSNQPDDSPEQLTNN